jgi:hypothetical protein
MKEDASPIDSALSTQHSAPSPRWPHGYRAALIVSIDVDGIYGEGNHRGYDDFYWRSQTEYDLASGVPRLLDVLRDREVASTFCWVGRCV